MGGMRNADMPFRRGQAGRAGTGPQDDVLPDKSVAGQVNKAAKTGKLDLASLDLTAIPPSLYTSLLGIPPDQLSRSPAPEKPDHDTIKGLASSMSTDLKLEGRGSREQAFGIKATAKEEWNDPEELTSFKADHNMIKEIEVEIGAFGGLKVLDVSHNQLTALPDTLADLLRLTSLNLSRNALSTLPPAILLLPKLEVLNLSHNALTSLSLQNGIEPSEDGLSYGAGFLSTSFSRAAANKQARPVLPILRSLDLGSNKISSTGLAGLKVGKGLQAMRVLNLEHNALEGVLDLEQVGMGKSAMGQLMSLVLRGNKMLRGTEGEVAEGCKVDLQGTIAGGDGGYSSSLATPGVAQCANTKYGNPSSIATLKSKPSSAHSGPAIQPSATIVYKTTPAASFDSLPLQIDMDVYLPPTAPSSGGAPSAGYPVVIWFHGGGLLQGNKENLPPHFRRLPSHPFPSSTTSGYEREHCIVISPNYRLAPQCPIIDILSDIRDCIAYVKSPKFPAALCKAVLPTNRADGQANMGVDAPAYKIDPNRICLSGGSAGGYLALLASIPMPGLMSDEEVGGYRGEMGIKCCAPFYPITDLTHEFWATKTDPVPWWSDSIPHEAAKPHLNPRDPPICTAISGGPRSILYPYMLQHALFPSLLFLSQRSIGRGLDGFRPTPESLSITHRLERLANLTGVNGRKVEGDGRVVPPVYMIYGTVDDKINPLDRDVEVLRRLEGQGRVKGTGVRVDVEHGKDHGFDESEEEECVGFREWLVENLF